ncbi:MAG: hypothetical protein AAB899_01465 [Patescibacteria group bacterium]
MKTREIPFTAEDFAAFKRAMIKHGFREISRVEVGRDFQRLGLIAPSPREGREVGFSFSSDGLQVVTWTTFLAWEGRPRKKSEDCGWVLILRGDKRVYVREVRRTSDFLYNLLWHSCIAKWRVENRPLCPECNGHMRIAFGGGLKARFWICVRPASHAKPVSRPWDYKLPQEALDFLRPIRKLHVRYLVELKKQGKKPGGALRRRKGWKIGRPENIV